MTLASTDHPNADQIAYWNGPAGQRWVQRQEEQDALLAPVGELLLERAGSAKNMTPKREKRRSAFPGSKG